ncbi:MAG: M28 family peptidase [Verrucomicrobiae bacterium]|nr:M28 family peptidase [Verrucomicrobiae bacterium]
MKLITRGAVIRLGIFLLLAGMGAVYVKTAGWTVFCKWAIMTKMDGKSHTGPLPPLTEREILLREELRQDVQKLAGEIGGRSVSCYQGLLAAQKYLTESLEKAGYQVKRQEYQVAGKTCANLEVEIKGGKNPSEIVIVGAHYDSAGSLPAANDNASGAAAVLALARAFKDRKPSRTLRFVEFANEEPPYFQTEQMGSLVYARHCLTRAENVTAMLCLETIGYYTDRENSQQYPPMFSPHFPSTGNFIAFIGNFASKKLVRQVTESFRRQAKFPSEAAATLDELAGVCWSDHWSFWKQGYPALMITDTAPFRYPYYHHREDTPDKLNYDCMARVVAGLEKVTAELAGAH